MAESGSTPSESTRSKKARRIAAAKKALDDAIAASEVGREPSYRPEFAIRATDLCMLGLTNEELADRFGVSPSSISHWIATIPEFSKAVYDGREGADATITRAAFLAARGYEHPEDDIRTVSIGDGVSEVRITPTTKHYPPNYNFANLILINRQRRRWPHRESDNAALGDKTPEQVARAARESIRAALSEVDKDDPDEGAQP